MAARMGNHIACKYHVQDDCRENKEVNDRIRELWRQCVLKHTGDPMNWQTVADEYAELIVRQCAEIADVAEPYKATDNILSYFGVEK